MECGPKSFAEAAEIFEASRTKAVLAANEEKRASAVADVDDALDALLNAPSSTISDVGAKLRALADEYGCEWQPRHIKGLVADLRLFRS
jgi:hypothetical protein